MRGYDLLAGGGYHDGLLVGVYHAGDAPFRIGNNSRFA